MNSYNNYNNKTWKPKRSITNGKEIIYEGLIYKTVRKYNNN